MRPNPRQCSRRRMRRARSWCGRWRRTRRRGSRTWRRARTPGRPSGGDRGQPGAARACRRRCCGSIGKAVSALISQNAKFAGLAQILGQRSDSRSRYFQSNCWANLRKFWGNPVAFCCRMAKPMTANGSALERYRVRIGLGHIVALCHRSSTLYQIHEHIPLPLFTKRQRDRTPGAEPGGDADHEPGAAVPGAGRWVNHTPRRVFCMNHY